MPENDEVYKNRDMVLGRLLDNSEHNKIYLEKMDEWCKEHDKKDDKRFMYGAISIILIALATGVLPQLMAYIKP